MLGQQGKRSRFLFLPLLVLVAVAARADQTASYIVRGPTGAALWGLGIQPGTEALAFAFSEVAPAKGDTPAPGPRLAFSVTQWAQVNGDWVHRQWYGDAPLDPKALTITADLATGTLDATVPGTLEEQSMMSGTVVRRAVSGRLQVQWTASSDVANSTTAYTYQTSAFATTLQSAGAGRLAKATATVTVDALGAPIELWGFGGLAAVTTGLLSVTMQ